MSEERMETVERCPGGPWDVAATETWLEDMARAGWLLTTTRRGKAVFKKGEPKDCRFRLQPLARRKETLEADREALYGQMGWTCLGMVRGLFWVWQCEDPAAPELDTDPVVQAEGYRYLKRQMIWSAALEALWLPLLLGLWVWIGRSATPLLNLLEDAPGRLTLWALLLPLWGWMEVRDLLCMRRLLRSLSAGVALERPRPYRGQLWLGRLVTALVCVMLVLPLLNGRNIEGSSLSGGWQARDRQTGAPRAEAVYLDLRALETGGGEPEYFRVKTKVHELAPRMYEVRQFLPLPDGGGAWAGSTYYRMLTPTLARRLAAELCLSRPGSLGVSPHGALELVAAPELDALWWSREGGERQYAVAVLGRQVLAVEYEGPTDLRTAGRVLADCLGEK